MLDSFAFWIFSWSLEHAGGILCSSDLVRHTVEPCWLLKTHSIKFFRSMVLAENVSCILVFTFVFPPNLFSPSNCVLLYYSVDFVNVNEYICECISAGYLPLSYMCRL